VPPPPPAPKPRPAPTAVELAAIDAYRNEADALLATADRLENGTLPLGEAEIAKTITGYRAARSKALADALAIGTGSADDVAGRLREAAAAMRAQLVPAPAGGRR
jgi:hypothetical protein